MSKWPLVCLIASACANNVPQDRSTGPDGRVKGALPMVFAENEAKVRGVVTYPGGDRVDWKQIDLPEGKKGRLDLQMTYTTPRPGLRVAFDVFDQWNVPVKNAVANGKGRIKSASIDKAKGKYFVRIYAPRRGDAGQYRLTAEFHEEVVNTGPGVLALNIPDPPKLPDVPPPPSTCEVFDRNDPVCGNKCPPGAPVDWKGCVGPTPPTPPVVATPPVPVPPVVVAKPVSARVLKVDVNNGGLDITVGGGSELGIAKGWRVTVLRGETSNPLSGGTGTIVRVNKTTTIVHVSLTTNQIGANPNVLLQP
ncbi:MAG: hypothetical protein IPQ07_28715 [Myxococcales bacterium]|nr:hypothetical protein [Myxococcales bacterium]